MLLSHPRLPFFVRFCPLLFIVCCSLCRPSAAIRCLNCRKEEQDLICNEPCEGDLCVLWKYREMSTDQLVQGCISGPDLRKSNQLKMGCRRNGMDAQLCLCSTPMCNADEEEESALTAQQQTMMPTDTRCRSHTSASFMTRQLFRPPRYTCQSDFCFFTQINTSRIPTDDPLSQTPRIESTTSRSCGPQPEFNFDILLGTIWPGNGLHSDACYLLETGRETLFGCSCSNMECNREVPYPIDESRRKRVKCQLMGSPPAAKANSDHFCTGHFCFVQRVPVHGYGDQWSGGCLSANESAARARLRSGHRNILGVEQWLCTEDWCNVGVGEAISRRRPSSEEKNATGSNATTRTTTKWPSRGHHPHQQEDATVPQQQQTTMVEGGRVQAQNQVRKWRDKSQLNGAAEWKSCWLWPFTCLVVSHLIKLVS